MSAPAPGSISASTNAPSGAGVAGGASGASRRGCEGGFGARKMTRGPAAAANRQGRRNTHCVWQQLLLLLFLYRVSRLLSRGRGRACCAWAEPGPQ